MNERLTRFMSLLLRHRPQDFSLKLDEQGYADLGEFIAVVQDKFPRFRLEDLEKILSKGKDRFELCGYRLRARYGHSFQLDLRANRCEPPEALYHAVQPADRERVLANGLQPADRSCVHLSLTPADALQFGHRRSQVPLIFKVLARRAFRSARIDFYDMGSVFLSGPIPPPFLEELPREAAAAAPKTATAQPSG